MKHYQVSGKLAAQAISQAIWRICLPDGSSATTSEAIGYRETLDGWFLDFDPNFRVLLANIPAAIDLFDLMSQAIIQAERDAMAYSLIAMAGQHVPILDLLPPTIAASLVDSSDLRYPPRPGGAE